MAMYIKSNSGVVITNKSQTQAQTQDEVLCSGFYLRLRNGDYQNPEIVFILRPGLHLAQELYSR